MRSSPILAVTLTLAALAAALATGCASDPAASASAPASAAPAPAAATQACALRSAGHAVLRLTVPAAVQVTHKDNFIYLSQHSPAHYVEIWLVPDAHSLDQAQSRLASVIAGEFTHFKPNTTAELTVAGAPARQLAGPGNEADDGDPGHADAILFQAAGHTFIALTHGEVLAPSDSQWLRSIVNSAHTP